MSVVHLERGREKSVRRRHPWIYDGAIARIEGEPGSGETVEIRSADGQRLGRGAYSPHSQLRVRVWNFEPDEGVDEAFFRRRLERALAARRNLLNREDLTACRLVHGESDGLPGVVVDRYGGFLVCQFLTAGAERWREAIVAALGEIFPVQGTWERSDTRARDWEGLEQRAGLLAGAEPPKLLEVRLGAWTAPLSSSRPAPALDAPAPAPAAPQTPTSAAADATQAAASRLEEPGSSGPTGTGRAALDAPPAASAMARAAASAVRDRTRVAENALPGPRSSGEPGERLPALPDSARPRIAPPDAPRAAEEPRPLRVFVDVRNGQKTGLYLDQRENLPALAGHATGAEVLNIFAYTGAFGLAALAAGAARVTHVESSAAALALAAENAELNGFDRGRIESVEGDAFAVLRRFRDSGRSFDLAVLDPPKFAESRGQLPRAARAYKDVNLLALKLLRPGGTLLTFSCSGVLESELFQKIVADAALDARREVQILRRLGQASDHPTLLSFPEGSYLKGLLCRVW